MNHDGVQPRLRPSRNPHICSQTIQKHLHTSNCVPISSKNLVVLEDKNKGLFFVNHSSRPANHYLLWSFKMKKQMTFTLFLLLLIVTYGHVLAAPPLPFEAWGEISAPTSDDLPASGDLTCVVNDVSFVATISEEDGKTYYTCQLLGDDLDTADVVEGGQENQTVSIRVNDHEVGTATWRNGEAEQVDLTLSAENNPAPTPTQPTATEPTPTATPPVSSGQPNNGSGIVEVPLIGDLFVNWQNILFPRTLPSTETAISIDADPATWQVYDTTGEDEGYCVNLQATGDLTNNDRTMPISNLSFNIPQENIAKNANWGHSSDAMPHGRSGSLSTSGINMLCAGEGEGTGVFDFVPQFQFVVPARTIGGTYTTTIYVSMTAGDYGP